MKYLFLFAVAFGVLSAQSIEATPDGAVSLRNNGDGRILAAAVCNELGRQRCVLLLDGYQEIDPGEARMISEASDSVRITARMPTSGWEIKAIVRESGAEIRDPAVAERIRDYFEEVVAIAAGNPTNDAGGMRLGAQVRSTQVRADRSERMVVGNEERLRAARILRLLPRRSKQPEPAAAGKSGPIGKNAVGYGFSYYSPESTWCHQGGQGPTVAHCEHWGICEAVMENPARHLSVGFEARTNCSLHFAEVNTDIRFRELVGSASIRHILYGWDMVPPGFHAAPCEGPEWIIPGGYTNSCSIFPF